MEIGNFRSVVQKTSKHLASLVKLPKAQQVRTQLDSS